MILGQLNVYIYLVGESKWVCFRSETVVVLDKMSTDPKKMETYIVWRFESFFTKIGLVSHLIYVLNRRFRRITLYA